MMAKCGYFGGNAACLDKILIFLDNILTPFLVCMNNFSPSSSICYWPTHNR